MPEEAVECAVDNCHRLPYAKTFCGPHYSRFRRYGDPERGGPLRMRAGDTFEEIGWFLSCGVHPALIADVLGQKPTTLARLCFRYGKSDWGAMFQSAA